MTNRAKAVIKGIGSAVLEWEDSGNELITRYSVRMTPRLQSMLTARPSDTRDADKRKHLRNSIWEQWEWCGASGMLISTALGY